MTDAKVLRKIEDAYAQTDRTHPETLRKRAALLAGAEAIEECERLRALLADAHEAMGDYGIDKNLLSTDIARLRAENARLMELGVALRNSVFMDCYGQQAARAWDEEVGE